MDSKWYSGHYNVTRTKHIHYLFIESLNEPEKDPIIVFFNGGPGGASIHLAFYGLSPLHAWQDQNGSFTVVDFN